MLRAILSAIWRGILKTGIFAFGAAGLIISLFLPRPGETVVEQAPSVPSASAVERAAEHAEAGRGYASREDVKLRYVRGLLAERASGREIGAAVLQTSMLTATQKSWLAMTTVAEAEVLVHESEKGLRRRLLGIGRGWKADAELVAERAQELWTCGPHGAGFELDHAAAFNELVSDRDARPEPRPAAG